MATLPNNAENWSLNVETHSREELIELSRAIAHSLPHRFLQNPENIPYILVPGSGGGGKSMIVEAMMKTLLDECDPDDMKLTNAKNEMFIERHPCQALYKYCQAVGHTNGASVLYGFDRKTSPFSPDAKNQLLHAFKKAARKHGVPPAGAIFTSNGDVGETEPWIVINLNAQGRRWERTLNIEVLNESLKSSLQFQHYWRKLKSFSETGILPGEALAPYPLLPRELFSESIVDPAAPDTELLKFALWHRNALRLSKEMIAQIAANMSDFGSAKAIGDFTAWLKEKNEHDTIELIEAEKSALKRLFFKYVASNTYAFDAHKFVQYTRQVSELENENPDTLKKSYKDYFIGQLKGRNKEKTQNFLTVISNFITDEEYSKLLHAFNPPQKLLKAQAGQRCLDALMNFEATLDSEHFPLTKKTIINTIEAYENATLKTRNVPPYKATIRPVLV